MIICFLPFEIVNDAVCLLCLRTEISLIAIDFLIEFELVFTLISRGDIETNLAFTKFKIEELSKYSLIVGSDICFWDELVDPVYRMIDRAINAGVKQIVISDPERPTFMKMAERCLKKHGGDLLEMETRGSVNARGSLLVIKNY